MMSDRGRQHGDVSEATANLRTKILDFGGFNSSGTLILRGGILMSMGNFPESLSQGILVGTILAGRLGGTSSGGCASSVLDTGSSGIF